VLHIHARGLKVNVESAPLSLNPYRHSSTCRSFSTLGLRYSQRSSIRARANELYPAASTRGEAIQRPSAAPEDVLRCCGHVGAIDQMQHPCRTGLREVRGEQQPEQDCTGTDACRPTTNSAKRRLLAFLPNAVRARVELRTLHACRIRCHVQTIPYRLCFGLANFLPSFLHQTKLKRSVSFLEALEILRIGRAAVFASRRFGSKEGSDPKHNLQEIVQSFRGSASVARFLAREQRPFVDFWQVTALHDT
jgi:hypothetical protein